MSWLGYALVSAFAAAFTAILAKIGVEGVPSTLATAIRTVVVMAFAWTLVLGLGQQHALASISRRSLVYLVLSVPRNGRLVARLLSCSATRARRMGGADRQTQLPLTVLLAVVWLREPVSWQVVAGVALMVAGALLTRA